MGLQAITATRAKDARACGKLHEIRYLLGYMPLHTPEALRFGSLVDKGIEGWWDEWRMHGAGDDRLVRALQIVADRATDPWERVRAEEMIRGYHARWGAEPLTVLAVQPEFVCPLVNPKTGQASRTWELRGKMDAIVRDDRNRVLVVETKTSAEDISPGSVYWRRLRMDGQVSMYYEGGRALGHDIEGCLYDVLGKPGQRPLKATAEVKYRQDGQPRAGQRLADETPEEYGIRIREAICKEPEAYYQRSDVVRLDAECIDYLDDLWQLTKRLRDDELAGRAVRTPESCERYGRLCSYFDVCSGVASLDDPTLFRRSTNVHPELTPREGVTHGDTESDPLVF